MTAGGPGVESRESVSMPRAYRMLWLMLASLMVSVGVGYAIGTKVAVNTLFNAWMAAWFVPAWLVPVLTYKSTKQPGAVPATVTMVAFLMLALLLGTMVFGYEKCPLVRLPQLATPGAR